MHGPVLRFGYEVVFCLRHQEALSKKLRGPAADSAAKGVEKHGMTGADGLVLMQNVGSLKAVSMSQPWPLSNTRVRDHFEAIVTKDLRLREKRASPEPELSSSSIILSGLTFRDEASVPMN